MYDRNVLLDQLKIDEGIRYFPYKDTRGNLTIGIGTNLDAGITEGEAEYLCLGRISDAETALTKNVPWWLNLDDNRQMALANLCYNMGINVLLEFKNMLGALHAGDYAGAADELLNSKYGREETARAQRIAALLRGDIS